VGSRHQGVAIPNQNLAKLSVSPGFGFVRPFFARFCPFFARKWAKNGQKWANSGSFVFA
jgi:hypothetical protein